jgi:glycoside/pentoside/hexuronide:cation symporter, GPH family
MPSKSRHHTSRPNLGGENYTLPVLGQFIEDVRQTFRNKIFRTMLSYEVASAIGWGSFSTLNILVATYVFEFDADEVALILAVPGLLEVVLVGFLLKPLGRKWQKPQLLRLAIWRMLVNTLWLLPLKLAGMLPSNGTPLILLLADALYWLKSFCSQYILRANPS